MIKDDIITFGNHEWRVLHVKDDRVLIITEAIIALRWYHSDFVDITWADCELRNYLNDEFYHTFDEHEKEKIIAVTNRNPANPWFKTAGGTTTTDHLFLLSLEEVCEYFGGDKANLLVKGQQKWLIDDEHNQKRQARYDSEYHWWRLRSPGYYGRTSASVNARGNIYVRGNGVHGSPRDGGGVRPALWLTKSDPSTITGQRFRS